jgi:hypothetical protein
MLTNLAVDAELFHSADGTAFADLMIDGHRETWLVRSSRPWLRRKYYQATGADPGAGAISSAINLLEARAQFDAPRRAVYLRVAEPWPSHVACANSSVDHPVEAPALPAPLCEIAFQNKATVYARVAPQSSHCSTGPPSTPSGMP